VTEPEISYSREMGLTHDDFWRLLPRAMGEHKFQRDGNNVHAKLHDGTVDISIGPPEIRRIALLAIPYSNVSFVFRNVSVEQQQAFKAHFDLYFQRGGG